MTNLMNETPSKAKYTIYKCDICKKRFVHEAGDKKCTNCGNVDETRMFVLDQKTSDTIEELYTDDDFQGG